ncbi:MAG: c-type cytochrome [Gammaproteobacteria bacterium]|nr:c-type cytochrome [Gammaproteobacteria bacterium]
MQSVVEDTAIAVVDDVAEAIETVVEQVEAVVNSNNKENEVEGALYSVVEGNKLDANSYEGFKLYRNWCARCHGTYGQGMVGPNLADSLKIISEKQFFDTVENGKTGTIGSMPSWKANVQVMEGRDQLYAYLKARSDGAIGEVKPKKQ